MSNLRKDPAFSIKYASLDLDSADAIRLSLGEWKAARQRLTESWMARYQSCLCDEISQTLKVFSPYGNDSTEDEDSAEVLAQMYALAAQACSDLEAAWHCLGTCFIRMTHAALRSALEATLTAVTFADPDKGMQHAKDYASDSTPVSGVMRRFEVTAEKLGIAQNEVAWIRDYQKAWLHPLTHPTAKSMKVTIVKCERGVALGNYFNHDKADEYDVLARNIVIVAGRIRGLFECAVPFSQIRKKRESGRQALREL